MSDSVSASYDNKVPRLKNSKGFALWRLYVMELMRKDGVLHVLSEDPPNPETSTNTVVSRWKRDDERARPHIVLNLGEEPATLVTSLVISGGTSRQVWQKLNDVYEKENIQTKLNLRSKLHNLAFKEGDNMEKHLTELEDVFLNLARLNDAVVDKDKCAVLLRSLPSSFSVIALMADANNMDYDSICSVMKSEIERRKGQATEMQRPEHIQAAARKADAPSDRRKDHRVEKRVPTCWHCGKKGHTRAECRKRLREEKSKRNHCGKWTSNTPQKSKEKKHKPFEADASSDESEDDTRKRHRKNGSHSARGFLAKLRSYMTKSSQPKSEKTWLDCGANEHFVWNREKFSCYRAIEPSAVETCGGASRIIGEGDVTFKIGSMDVTLTCKHAPDFAENIISLSKFIKSFNCQFVSDTNFEGCVISNKSDNRELHRCRTENGLYPMPGPNRPKRAQMAQVESAEVHWHRSLGHIGSDRLIRSIDQVDGLPKLDRKLVNDLQCIPCIESKTKRAPIPVPTKRITKPLELTHTDISGKISVQSLGGCHYFVVFLDDATSMSAVYFLTKRSEFFDALKAYKALVENQRKERMFALRLDRAGENISGDVKGFLQSQGMKLEPSPAHASQSNGSSERLIQSLWTMARTMMTDSRMDLDIWSEAISHSNWLRNRTPSKRIDLCIPYTAWFDRKPDLSALIPFGEKGYAFQYRSSTVGKKKFLPRTNYGRFVGMESEHALYRIYSSSKKGIIITRKADFTILREDTQLPSFSTLTDNLSRHRQLEEIEQSDEAASAEDTLTQCYFLHFSQLPSVMKANTRDTRLPRNFKEACQNRNWCEAIDREFEALCAQETWTLVKRTPDMKPIPFLWDFRVNDTYGTDNAVIYKARCCLRGDKQVVYQDFDPHNLYAPVVRHETIRMFLAKVAAQDLILEGADVSNAYLYGDIDAPIIMDQPTNSSGKPHRPGYVCQLNKSIYGARQAGEIWGGVINTKFVSWGFKQSSQDQRLYLMVDGTNFIILIVVVDDMAFASNNRSLIDRLKKNLSETFKVKLLGQLKAFVGWEIKRTATGLYVNQPKYIQRMLQLHNFTHVKPLTTPLPIRCDLTSTHEDDVPLSSNEHSNYRSLIGSLSYLAICTRPDISFAVSSLARKLHAPCARHLILAKRVVRYVSYTANKSILFPNSSISKDPLTAYSDSDWAGCHETRRSTTGIVIKVNGAPIFWTSKRQTMVTVSSAEAEYIAISSCGKHISWLRRLFHELQTHVPIYSESDIAPTVIYTDSTAAISLATRPQVSERNKHIEIKAHHIKDLMEKGVVILKHIRTINQPADLLTKSVSEATLNRLLTFLNM